MSKFAYNSELYCCAIQKNHPMLKEEQLSGQVLDHLGLIYSVIDKISLIDKVDKYLPVSSKHGSKVTMGQRVAAMILNGLVVRYHKELVWIKVK